MFNRIVYISALVLLSHTSIAQAEESSEPPGIAKRAAISASLSAMQNNGVMKRARQRARANLRSRIGRNGNLAARIDDQAEPPVPIKHVLVCDSKAECQSASDWGNNNGFNATPPLSSRGHGGEPMYHLYLRQEVLPETALIHAETSRVNEGAQTLEGVRYATWMLDLDPAGDNDQEAE